MPPTDPSPGSSMPDENSQSAQGGAMPPNGGAPDSDDQQGTGPAQVMQQFTGIRDIMAQSLQGIAAQKDFPPEGTKALTSALQAYTQFLQVFGKFLGVQNPAVSSPDQGTMGTQGADQQGQKNAMPADQAANMGRNVKAVPA